MSKTPFFVLSHLSFSYGEGEREALPILRDLSFTVEEGEFVAVLGHNGSGKSTLAKLLNLILTPDEGKIFVMGREVTAPDFTEEDLYDLRKQVGMVFQNPDNQLVATVVEEDVAFGPENLGLPSEEIRRRVDAALAAVHMEGYAKHAAARLSGGQKQRIAIAGVLAMQPKCIIFDESTAMLDPVGRREVMDTIRMLHKTMGITVLLITHHMDEAVLADRVLVIDDGRLLYYDTPRTVFSHVEKLRMVGLDVPQITELFYELRAKGINLPEEVLDEKEGAALLTALLS